MLIRFYAAFLLLALFSTHHAVACPARTHQPVPGDPSQYSQIFLAHIKAIEPVSSLFSHSDLTPPYKLTLIKSATLIGPEFKSQTIDVGPGCGWPRPKVGVRALFFVEKKDGVIVPLYEYPERNQLDSIIAEIKRAKAK